MEKKIYINNLSELERFASNLSRCLKGNEIILLRGNLGSGKTTFTKFLVKSLGGNEEEVNSPTFTVMNEYDTDTFTVYHIDLYRVKRFDITDFVGHGVIVVEWPSEDYSLYSVPVIEISFDYGKSEESRVLTFSTVYKSDYIYECLKED